MNYRTILSALFFVFNLSLAAQVYVPAYSYDPPAKGVLRILSYNVKNCGGMDGKRDCDRTAAVIRTINPEVIAMQELDSATQRSGGVDILKTLAEKLDMYHVFGPSISYQGGKYGIGILSKEKPLRTSFLSLPGREERRGLLMAEFADYILFCTHLSLTREDRVESCRIINEQTDLLKKKAFLAGDFNDTEGSEALNTLNLKWTNLSGNKPTIPVTTPEDCIDFIFGLNCFGCNYTVQKREVVNEQMASDHLPVFVDVLK